MKRKPDFTTVQALIRFSIEALTREKENHERRLKTLNLAISAMEGELQLLTTDWESIPQEAFDRLGKIYSAPSAERNGLLR